MEVFLPLWIAICFTVPAIRVRRVPRIGYVLVGPPVGPPRPPVPHGPARRPLVPPRPSRPPVAAPRPAPIIIQGPAYVTDGDGLIIRKANIRLFGIDAPEQNHPYGIRAKRTLMWLCKGQHIRAEVTGKDHFGRTVAICSLPDGRDLSAEMVKCGLALDWPKFSGGRYRYLETPDARRKLWLADARQKGRMDVWARFEAQQAARRA
ncbi:thermonuclease family protein [Loktanella agnita]|uniref:thermonuclease family protein n=1 Tax=Loktanella agnita TaxID=287097 RepID=UPI0039874F7D